MKFDGKPMAIALALVCLLLFPIEAAAQTDTYVLKHPSAEGSDWKPYSYVTPFMVNHTVQRRDGSRYYSGSCAPQIFSLIGAGADESGEGIAAYCADSSVGIVEGTSYRRVNLEDSTGFHNTIAGKLRAVVMHAYPHKGVDAIQESANAWLRERELPETQQLQSGEAILAAQIAIWKLTGGNRYTVHSLYGGTMELTEYQNAVMHREELTQQATEYTPRNVESLYTYFSNLEAVPPSVHLVSDTTITRTVYTCVKEADGTYTGSVSVTVNLHPGEWDTLTLTATSGEEMQSQPISAAGEYTFLFPGQETCVPVTLEIDGTQYGSDVFLFEAAGEKGTSQTLIGYDSSTLPVHCERVLTLAPSAASAVPVDDGFVSDVSMEETGENGTELLSISSIHAMGVIILGSACILILGNYKKR